MYVTASAVGVAPTRHRDCYDSSARFYGEHQERASRTGIPIRDGYMHSGAEAGSFRLVSMMGSDEIVTARLEDRT